MKLKIKSIVPMFDHIVTTAHTYTTKEATINGILDPNMEGKYKPIQKVIALGERAKSNGVRVDSLIMINFERYGKPVQAKDENSINASMENYHVKMMYSVPVIELDGKEHLYIASNDIEYIITDYEEIEDEPISKIITEQNKKIIL